MIHRILFLSIGKLGLHSLAGTRQKRQSLRDAKGEKRGNHSTESISIRISIPRSRHDRCFLDRICDPSSLRRGDCGRNRKSRNRTAVNLAWLFAFPCDRPHLCALIAERDEDKDNGDDVETGDSIGSAKREARGRFPRIDRVYNKVASRTMGIMGGFWEEKFISLEDSRMTAMHANEITTGGRTQAIRYRSHSDLHFLLATARLCDREMTIAFRRQTGST